MATIEVIEGEVRPCDCGRRAYCLNWNVVGEDVCADLHHRLEYLYGLGPVRVTIESERGSAHAARIHAQKGPP